MGRRGCGGFSSDRLRENHVQFVCAGLFLMKHRNSTDRAEALTHQLAHAILEFPDRIGGNHFIVVRAWFPHVAQPHYEGKDHNQATDEGGVLHDVGRLAVTGTTKGDRTTLMLTIAESTAGLPPRGVPVFTNP
jgi:hypothetical protein